MAVVVPSYKGFRFPVEIISHCVWLYHRFPLSLRDVEEMMLERGIVVTYETIRQWCRTFGQTYANGLRRRRPRPGDTWHLDEVFIKIRGKTHYLETDQNRGRSTFRAPGDPPEPLGADPPGTDPRPRRTRAKHFGGATRRASQDRVPG